MFIMVDDHHDIQSTPVDLFKSTLMLGHCKVSGSHRHYVDSHCRSSGDAPSVYLLDWNSGCIFNAITNHV
jgi:hypothetical protein